MRKPNKSVLTSALTLQVPKSDRAREMFTNVIDGGGFIHALTWPPQATFDNVVKQYVDYAQYHYGKDLVVVFDG